MNLVMRVLYKYFDGLKNGANNYAFSKFQMGPAEHRAPISLIESRYSHKK